jgi:hypothetical protein
MVSVALKRSKTALLYPPVRGLRADSDSVSTPNGSCGTQCKRVGVLAWGWVMGRFSHACFLADKFKKGGAYNRRTRPRGKERVRVRLQIEPIVLLADRNVEGMDQICCLLQRSLGRLNDD